MFSTHLTNSKSAKKLAELYIKTDGDRSWFF